MCGWEINPFFPLQQWGGGGGGGEVRAASPAWEVLVRLFGKRFGRGSRTAKGWGCFRVPSLFMSVVFNRRQSGTGSRQDYLGIEYLPFLHIRASVSGSCPIRAPEGFTVTIHPPFLLILSEAGPKGWGRCGPRRGGGVRLVRWGGCC